MRPTVAVALICALNACPAGARVGTAPAMLIPSALALDASPTRVPCDESLHAANSSAAHTASDSHTAGLRIAHAPLVRHWKSNARNRPMLLQPVGEYVQRRDQMSYKAHAIVAKTPLTGACAPMPEHHFSRYCDAIGG